jgi:DNA-binding transcriptional MerR regulator
MLYNTRHITNLFSVSHTTVKNWAIEFERHLSVTAAPGDGRHRNFTDEDLEVLALIHELKKQGMTYSDIHAALDNGQRGNPPLRTTELIAATEQKQQLVLLTNRIRQLETQVQELEQYHDENLKQQGIIKQLETEVNRYRVEVRELYEEIGLLKAKGNSTKE